MTRTAFFHVCAGILALMFAGHVFAQDLSGGEAVQEQSTGSEPPVREGAESTRTAEETGLSGTLIVLNKSEASASLIDLSTGNELERIETGVGPHEVAVSPNGKTAVVCNYGDQTPGNTLTVIDIPRKMVTSTIDLGEYHRPHGIAFVGQNNYRVAVTCEHERNVVIVALRTGDIEQVIPTEADVSHMLVLDPNAPRAYVTNIASDSMTVLDLDRGEPVKEIETGAQAEGIDIAPDGSEVWVSNRANNTVSVIDTETLEITHTLDSPDFPIRVKFTPSGEFVLVSNLRSGDVSVFLARTKDLFTRISMEEQPVEDDSGRLFAGTVEGTPAPIGILILPSGSHAFIANTMADVVTVIDLAALKVVGRIPTGKQPDGLGYSPISLTPPKPPTIGR